MIKSCPKTNFHANLVNSSFQNRFMELNPIVLSIPIYFILIGIEVTYDLIKNKGYYRFGDAINNISCGITEQITGVFGKVITIAIYHFFYTYARIFDVPQTWYWAVILFIGVDFFYYWAHRYSHEINLFWTGHSIHHQSEDYNFSVALRQGAFQKIFTAWFFIPLAILGFQTEWFLYIGAFSTLYQFWIHTEAIDKLPKWFEYIFNTPSHHRVHHGRNPKYIDKNHGGTFIIFDRLFGTFQNEEERPTYGVTSPVNSYNPLVSHWKPFEAIWKDLQVVKGLKNKFLLLVNPPGWLPSENGGFRKPPEVQNDFKKYHQSYSKSLQWYVLLQYAIILGVGASFLFQYANYQVPQQLGIASFVLFQIGVIGMILDQTTSSKWMEYTRLFLLLIFLLLSYGINENIIAVVITTVLSISAYWFYKSSNTSAVLQLK